MIFYIPADITDCVCVSKIDIDRISLATLLQTYSELATI